MKCQSCGKKEATVRYKENINGKKQEFNFCLDCAKNLGFVQFSNVFSPLFMNVPNYLLEEKLECPTCGYTLNDYSNTGMFGCQDCYNTFEEELDELFLKLHGKNRHVKIDDKVKKIDEVVKPIKKSKKCTTTLESLKIKLKELVDKEKYEEAALIRDKIREIEGKQV
ncbi:MAG: UvrB/UvrC motif-containing protein [Clostridia bacterium]